MVAPAVTSSSALELAGSGRSAVLPAQEHREHDSLNSEADRVVLRGPQGWRMLHLHQHCYVDWEPSIATEE
jgi:hypothetical protein